MPIYEFQCQSCGGVSEHIMKISDENPAVCPHCGAEKTLSKLMSRTSFVLKGQGWYETDFKNSSSGKGSSSSKASSEKSSKASSGTKK